MKKWGHTWTILGRLAQDRSRWRTDVVNGLKYAPAEAEGQINHLIETTTRVLKPLTLELL